MKTAQIPPPSLVKTQILPLEKIFPSATNPRTHFPPEEQAELEGSMRSIGFTISTLLVRPEQNTYFIDNTQPDAADGGQFWIMRQTGLAPLQGLIESVEMCPTKEAAQNALAKLQGRFELVAGERRYRAARAVGLTDAPCIVQSLSDREVLEIQLIENAQRKDLTTLEEAVGYGRLLDLRDETGASIYTPKSLAVKLGKSSRTVERVRKLRVLVDDAGLKDFRKALENGVVTVRHASLVARMPDAKLRAQLAKQILAPKYDEAPLSLRKAELLAQKEFMVDLREAPFSQGDADLLPVETDADGQRLRGGACLDCPFKVANAQSMFDGDVPSGLHNMCMSPACYEAKREIGWKQWQERETDPDSDRRALSEAECKKLYRYGDQLDWNCPLVDLAEKPDSSDLKAGEEAPGTWRSMLKGVKIGVIVARDRNGKKHELVDRALARAAVEKAAKDKGEKTIFKAESKASGSSTSNGSRGETDEERAARLLKREREIEIETAQRGAVAAKLSEKASTGKALPAGFWIELIETLMDEHYGNAPDAIEERRGWAHGNLVNQMKKLTEHHQVGVIVEFLYLDAHLNGGGKTLLKLFGVEAGSIEKEAAIKVKADQKKRDVVIEEIAKLAGVATLKEKDLDGIATALWKKKFSALKATHELEAVRDEIVKRSNGVKKNVAPKKKK